MPSFDLHIVPANSEKVLPAIHTEWTSVERAFLAQSGRKDAYDNERAPVIEVQNVYELGRIVTLSFLEWISANPEGVIALPTGKTPEYFIKTMELYHKNWFSEHVQKEIIHHGYPAELAAKGFPDTSRLHFVMLDEFFPMLPTHRNSFCNYVRNFYTGPLQISADRILDFDLLAQNVITSEEMKVFDKIDVDLSLLTRTPENDDERQRQAILLKVQAFCDQFEERVRALGGIGFFLGGIGPDGHIAFNQEGSAHDCKTRLVSFNYPTAAAAASDLGGIEKARGKAAMTIGLQTITYNRNAKIIIMAAGEGKANVIRAGIEDPASEERPSSVLHGLPNARFYITHGAALKLTKRKIEKVKGISEKVLSWALVHLAGTDNPDHPHLVEASIEYSLMESMVYDLSLQFKTPVHELSLEKVGSRAGEVLPDWLMANPLAFQLLCATASRRLKEKVQGGLKESSLIDTRILHTAPHHDDIMLSYHGAMHDMLGRQEAGTVFDPALAPPEDNQKRTPRAASQRARAGSFTAAYTENNLGESFNANVNHFAYLTSGFHSVNDDFLWAKVNGVLGPWQGMEGTVFLEEAVAMGQLTREYDQLMSDFRKAFLAKDEVTQDHIENIIFLRKIAEVWRNSLSDNYKVLCEQLRKEVEWIKNDYLLAHMPGDAVPKEMQLLKGCMRESEVDRVWALSRMPMNRIHHLRSKFYTDDFFTPMPSLEDDALPMANLIRDKQPKVLTVAFDPEGTGPDTHYKVLQVVAAGLRISLNRSDLNDPDVLVWGYRNVWFVFPPSQATLMIPCTQSDLDLMHDTFMSCFTTQKKASFPSPLYDGPFSAWARQIQKDQREMLSILLGEDFFLHHVNPKVRDCAGFIFIQAMPAQQFLAEVEELKSKFENV